MPASSKAQQRFFGVVKAMQKGDIPKKGKAGKIAKQMSKGDVDDFASTKHKGKPEKVKREQRVKNLIKKMVREELAKMNEGSRGPCWKGYTQKGMKKKGDRMVPNCVKNEEKLKEKIVKSDPKVWVPDKFDKYMNKLPMSKIRKLKEWEVIKIGEKFGIKDWYDTLKWVSYNFGIDYGLNEGTCGYGVNGQLGEEPAGPHLIKKKKINPKMKKILSDLGEKNPAQLVATLQAVVK